MSFHFSSASGSLAARRRIVCRRGDVPQSATCYIMSIPYMVCQAGRGATWCDGTGAPTRSGCGAAVVRACRLRVDWRRRAPGSRAWDERSASCTVAGARNRLGERLRLGSRFAASAWVPRDALAREALLPPPRKTPSVRCSLRTHPIATRSSRPCGRCPRHCHRGRRSAPPAARCCRAMRPLRQ